jgi:hypothetical protein
MSEFKEVLSNWVKFTVVGDCLEGTLVGAENKLGVDPQGRPQTQRVYEILTDEGKFHNTKKEGGMKVPDLENPIIVEKGEYYNVAKGSIDNAMKKIKIGQKVKFIFDSVIESKDKMKNDFKLVKVYAGDMDNEYLESVKNSGYNEVGGGDDFDTSKAVGMDEIKVEEIPFKTE